MTRLPSAVLAATLLLALSGCAYDYMQRTDRVAFSAGNAVQANLARETTNPSKKSMTKTDGLGADGLVVSDTQWTEIPSL
jgi:hypothetical protein